ncbi:MAG: ABC transporter permease [Candidatus Nanosyncoccaceae bacterium]|jgi:ABC-type antimicrobial peptide transport system permease subunit
MILFNHISNTKQNLRANRTRNFLTILGITIGATCISLVLALIGGASQLGEKDLVNYKSGTILVRPASPKIEQGKLFDLATSNWVADTSLSLTDVQALSEIQQVRSATPILPLAANINLPDKKVNNQLIVGTTPSLSDSTNFEVLYGQLLSSNIVDNAVVLGEDLAVKLFSSTDCVGQTISVRDYTMLIIGVIRDTNHRHQTGGIDFNTTALVSTSTAKHLTNNTAQIKQINIVSHEDVNLSSLHQQIEEKMALNHSTDDTFTVIGQTEENRQLSRSYQELGLATLVVAIIALIIGGIGVMNIMLVNVAEQTHEIGIRRSIGATTSDIIGQFLIESMIICLIGGIAGLAISYGITFMFQSTLPLPTIYDWPLVATVLGITLGIGVVAGIIPAIKAAAKNPIEALRQS